METAVRERDAPCSTVHRVSCILPDSTLENDRGDTLPLAPRIRMFARRFQPAEARGNIRLSRFVPRIEFDESFVGVLQGPSGRAASAVDRCTSDEAEASLLRSQCDPDDFRDSEGERNDDRAEIPDAVAPTGQEHQYRERNYDEGDVTR